MPKSKNIPEPVAIAPRDTSGSTASNRFDYQKNWTIGRILERHVLPGDYVVLCDYHDDVVLIEVEQYQSLHFYQLKTKGRGNWTMTQLTRRKANGGKGQLSIIGKMCQHRIDFTDRVASMTLVSNARFSMELASGENATLRTMLFVRDLSSTAQHALRTAIETELGASSIPDMTDIAFLVTEQAIGRHDDQTVGQLAKFLEAVGVDVDALATHRALFDEIKRRTNAEGTSVTLDDLVRTKGFTRRNFEELLAQARVTRAVSTWRPAIGALVQRSGLTLGERSRLLAQCERYVVQRLNETNIVLQRLRDSVVDSLILAERDGILDPLQQVEHATAAVRSPSSYNVSYIRAVAIVESIACDHPKLQEADPESEDEAP